MPSLLLSRSAVAAATVAALALATISVSTAAAASIVPDPIEYSADDAALALSPVGTFETGVFDESGAEIVAAHGHHLFVVNAQAGAVSVLDYSDPTAIAQQSVITSDGIANSVAVRSDGLGIIAFEAAVKTDRGHLVFFDAVGDGGEFPILGEVTVGALPDMVSISADGTFAVVANEGEPADDFSIDPEGSISVVRLPAPGLAAPTQSDVRTADFHAFEAGGALNLPDDVRVFGPAPHGDDLPVSRNLEPEFIAIDGDVAYASLQEANAVAEIDLATAAVTAIWPLGFKDLGTAGNGIDPSDRDPRDAPTFDVRTFEGLHGVYMPDGINAYQANGQTYLVTANEGDAREWGDYAEPVRVGDLADDGFGPVCDDSPLAGSLGNDQLGRLNVTKELGFDAAAGCYSDLYAFGGRSFSIWTTDGTQVYDSGDSFEEITHTANPDFFNSSHTASELEGRSDDKGPEPENLSIGAIGDRTYAFIGFERVGGIAVYDITDPGAATFVTYVNNRDFSVSVEDADDPAAVLSQAGDLGPEGVTFIPATSSATGSPLLAVANEVSGTTTLFSVVDLLAPVNTAPPTISGSPDFTRTLKADPGRWTPVGGNGKVTFDYQWLLDGEPIRGATKQTYTVGLLDTGHEIIVRVRTSQSGQREAVATSAPLLLRYSSIALVTPSPRVATTSSTVVVTVQVRPSNFTTGATRPTGTVKITVAGKSFTGTLDGSGFTVRIPVGKLPRGIHPIVANYSGDIAVSPTRGLGVVLVR
ncbi:choice-of-anchor I family protein [Microbacterium pumilum]|uniref:Choice-of-anchor I domain-containing protein n=1 Tax=Microbacterium pumilum TaxID=344165 RepID=A0ABP5D8I2_9MICO